MIDFAFIAGIGVAALAVGFLAGLFAYSHVHQHFFAKAEELSKKRVTSAINQERATQAKLREARQRMRQQFGPDLSAKHADVIDEEVEKVLGSMGERK